MGSIPVISARDKALSLCSSSYILIMFLAEKLSCSHATPDILSRQEVIDLTGDKLLYDIQKKTGTYIYPAVPVGYGSLPHNSRRSPPTLSPTACTSNCTGVQIAYIDICTKTGANRTLCYMYQGTNSIHF